MQKRYLLSCDLDESLLKKDKTISLRTRLYIRKYVRNGNIFMINTGRPYQSALHFYKMLKIKNMPIVGLNGTHVAFIGENYDLINYIQFGFNKQLIKEFLEEIMEYLIGAHIEDIGNHYLLKDGFIPDWLDETHVGSIKIHYVDDFIGSVPDEPLLANLYLKKENASKLDEVLAKEKYQSLKNEIWTIKDDIISYEIHDRKVDKSSTMEYMASYYGIEKDHLIAFGDNQNDIDMLKKAGIGVAMCNGLDIVKSEVKHVTRKDNNHDGVVDYLKYLKIK